MTYPPPVAAPPRRGRLIAGVVAGVLAAGVGGVVSADAYAKHVICTAVRNDLAAGATGAADDSDDPDQVGNISAAATRLHRYGNLLMFHGSLATAAAALAGDLDQLAALQNAPAGSSATVRAKVMVIAGSVNTHARATQRACGLPASGVFGS
jgi:hypothetical protein